MALDDHPRIRRTRLDHGVREITEFDEALGHDYLLSLGIRYPTSARMARRIVTSRQLREVDGSTWRPPYGSPGRPGSFVGGVSSPRGLADGAAERVAAERPEGRASAPERLVAEGDADSVGAAVSDGDALGVASSVVDADREPPPSFSSVPTLVPPWLLLNTGPPVTSSRPVTRSSPTAKISTAAPANNGHRRRRAGTAGAIEPVVGRSPAGRCAGITWVTSAAISSGSMTWVASGSWPGRGRTRATTTLVVWSSDRSYAAAATAETTDPTAAPTTVPSAPNTDPTTAVVAAAPAPATILLTVRLGFAAPRGGGCEGWLRNDEVITLRYRTPFGA